MFSKFTFKTFHKGTFQFTEQLLYFIATFYSTDESATERILKSEQAYAHLCGALDMTLTRDAFITALCKASLPPNYALTVLNMYPQQGLPKGERTGDWEGEREGKVRKGVMDDRWVEVRCRKYAHVSSCNVPQLYGIVTTI